MPSRARDVEVARPPSTRSLRLLAEAAASCTACPLHRGATQTVFGAGPRAARVVLVGEQPGDREDLAGLPFVGPAGQLLDRALVDAGLAGVPIYRTNAVKHFKWAPRGKRRIHQKPNAGEIRACRPWLAAELRAIEPAVIVCLGATAARALLGPSFRLTKQRGELLATPGGTLLATIHPSAVLRAPDDVARAEMFAGLTADLAVVRRALGRPVRAAG